MEPARTASIINYFENVLGIKSLFIQPVNFEKTGRPVIFIQDFGTYSAAEIELTKKILSAVSLDFSEIDIKYDMNTTDIFTLVFKDEPAATTEIYSPRILQSNPELKKVAWEKLKSIVS